MSDETKEPPLQFDKAEFTQTGPLSCGVCSTPIHGVYYQVGDKVACERCRADLALQQTAGSGFSRFVKATAYGLGGGAMGAGIWYGVRALTGYEIGLIAIVVGLLVGGGVRAGSGGRGGWRYQTLAMFLTYASIVSTYVPMIVKMVFAGAKEAGAATASSASPAVAAPESVGTHSPEPAAPAAVDEAAPVAETGPAGTPTLGQGLLAVALFGVLVFAIAFAAPFLAGFENIMGIVIIGIALYEAWKINVRAPTEITGPYRVGAAPTADAGASS